MPGQSSTVRHHTERQNLPIRPSSLPGKRPYLLHLLPYHRLGQGKYDGLGREYKLDGIDLIPNEYMQELLEVAKKSGLECQIGG